MLPNRQPWHQYPYEVYPSLSSRHFRCSVVNTLISVHVCYSLLGTMPVYFAWIQYISVNQLSLETALQVRVRELRSDLL
jgi:hypothetical protein